MVHFLQVKKFLTHREVTQISKMQFDPSATFEGGDAVAEVHSIVTHVYATG